MKLKKFKDFINESDINSLDDGNIDINPKDLKKTPIKKGKKMDKSPVKIPNWNTY